MTRLRVVILEDNQDFVQALTRASRTRMEVLPAATVDSAKQQVDEHVDLVLVDLFIGAKAEGMELLRWIGEEHPKIPVVIVTGYGDIDRAVEAMRLGADDFIDKGRATFQEILKRIDNVLERRRLRRQVTELEQRLELYEPHAMIGRSRTMEELRRVVQTVAEEGEVSVLLRGETGTGKELVARLIHSQGKRGAYPFVPVDLSTLPRETLASELFGYEPGAFTGAEKMHIGYVEAADKGVLFLDEIGELSQDLQGRLFRTIEERTVTRLGSTQPRPVDVQLVTATNLDLEGMVERGQFRAELYYRLRVFEIRLPPLREHPEDIPDLVENYLQQWGAARRTPLRRVAPAAVQVLQSYHWPGNVRELRNVLESASVWARMKNMEELDVDLLPIEVRNPAWELAKGVPDTELKLKRALAKVELACVAEALMRTRLRKEAARELLGYQNRHTMRRRLSHLRKLHPDLWTMYPILEEYYTSNQKLSGDATPLRPEE